MKKIWKHTLDLRAHSQSGELVTLPRDARIVHAAVSPSSQLEDLLDFWFEFEVTMAAPQKTEKRVLHVFGTGQSIPDRRKYVATAVGAHFVWHLYEQ